MKTQPFLFSGRIYNCYDSHVHWQATGSFARKLALNHIRNSEDILNLNPQKENFLGEWLLGFGWDQNLFDVKKFPTRQMLDQKFPNTPVYFTRTDGHAAWVNTEALRRAGLSNAEIKVEGGHIFFDNEGRPEGVFIDNAMKLFDEFVLPSKTSIEAQSENIEKDLLTGQKKFLEAGFTHIRDMTCDPLQWEVAQKLDYNQKLLLQVEQFFTADSLESFKTSLNFALAAKKKYDELASEKKSKTHLHPRGIKVFFDGALGSEGALLSQPYSTASVKNPDDTGANNKRTEDSRANNTRANESRVSDRPTKNFGLQLLSANALNEMMAACFNNKLEIAIHVIGDEAAHRVALVATQLKNKNITGTIHLEHVELIRPETISLLQNLDVICHMQPCHWLSDKRWLESKIGDLISHAFRWQDLSVAKIPIYFGSDSPIEKSSLQKNFVAIHDALDVGLIPLPKENFEVYQSASNVYYPSSNEYYIASKYKAKRDNQGTYTEYKNGLAVLVVVDNKVILQNN